MPNDNIHCSNTPYFNAKEDSKLTTTYVIMLIISAMIFKQLECCNLLDEENDPFSILKKLKRKNPTRILIGLNNINSIRNKFNQLKYLINDTLDIMLISETKLNNTFPEGQFFIKGYSRPYRLGRTANGRGLILYIREHISSKIINADFLPKIEGFFIELNLRKSKWLLLCSYNPHKNMIDNHLNAIGRQLDSLCEKYESILLLGDFNSELTEDSMQDFCNIYNLKCLVKEPTCFKNPDNPSCIDLLLTNKYRSLQNTTVFESRLSDFHKFTITVMKISLHKQKPKVINYRNYKTFNNSMFRTDFLAKINKDNTYMGCQQFENTFLNILNAHVPLKQRYLRANDAPFMNKTLRKAIMHRSKLRNKYLKLRMETSKMAFKKQEIIVSVCFEMKK